MIKFIFQPNDIFYTIFMRTEGAFEYDERSEKIILDHVDIIPKSTTTITEELRSSKFAKISPQTVKRLLESLKIKGMVKCMELKNTLLWSR